MDTSELAGEIQQLKNDIKNRVKDFNKKTGLMISGAIIEGVSRVLEQTDTPIIVDYHVGINIEL